eukprot:8315265-Pyramimonas_sp.AAC.1
MGHRCTCGAVAFSSVPIGATCFVKYPMPQSRKMVAPPAVGAPMPDAAGGGAEHPSDGVPPPRRTALR